MRVVKKRDQLHRLLDEQLRVKRWPSRLGQRLEVLDYIAAKFESERAYTEAAVNALIRRWCVFDDPALIRRELFDRGYVRRTRDCRSYWRQGSGGASSTVSNL